MLKSIHICIYIYIYIHIPSFIWGGRGIFLFFVKTTTVAVLPRSVQATICFIATMTFQGQGWVNGFFVGAGREGHLVMENPMGRQDLDMYYIYISTCIYIYYHITYIYIYIIYIIYIWYIYIWYIYIWYIYIWYIYIYMIYIYIW